MRFQVRTDPEQAVDADADILLDWFFGGRVQSTVQYEPAFLRALVPSAVADDLFVVGGAVFCADKLSRRAAAADLWTRDLELRVPVSDVDLWTAGSDRLHEALSFLSGDRWKVDFVEREVPGTDPQEALEAEHDEVVSLFSGGLDSLAGVIELLEAGQRVVLVGHHDSSLTDNRQTALFAALSDHYGSDRVTQRRLLLRPAAPGATQYRPLPRAGAGEHDPSSLLPIHRRRYRCRRRARRRHASSHPGERIHRRECTADGCSRREPQHAHYPSVLHGPDASAP